MQALARLARVYYMPIIGNLLLRHAAGGRPDAWKFQTDKVNDSTNWKNKMFKSDVEETDSSALSHQKTVL